MRRTSKDPLSGYTGAAVFIPRFNIVIKERTSEHISVYAAELVAILLGLRWTEDNIDSENNSVVIATDSQAYVRELLSLRYTL